MRFHESRYPDFYIERLDPWEVVCRTPNKSWKKELTVQEKEGPSGIFYWRDFEGAKKTEITRKDYCFKNWQKSRLSYRTLPLYYGMGRRFIKLEKDFPAGFNFTYQPMSLAEVHKIEGIVVPAKKERRARK